MSLVWKRRACGEPVFFLCTHSSVYSQRPPFKNAHRKKLIKISMFRPFVGHLRKINTIFSSTKSSIPHRTIYNCEIYSSSSSKRCCCITNSKVIAFSTSISSTIPVSVNQMQKEPYASLAFTFQLHGL